MAQEKSQLKTVRSTQWEQAARLCAEDTLPDEQIAHRVGISRRQLIRWKQQPEFDARIAEVVEEYRAAIMRAGIADKVERVKRLCRRADLMEQLLAERGEELAGKAAGGSTGMLCRRLKRVDVRREDPKDKGPRSLMIYEYQFDAALLREMREHEKQVAVEVGDWAEKDGAPQEEPEDEFDRRIAELVEAVRANSVPIEPEQTG